jgi:hypothetical protein
MLVKQKSTISNFTIFMDGMFTIPKWLIIVSPSLTLLTILHLPQP